MDDLGEIIIVVCIFIITIFSGVTAGLLLSIDDKLETITQNCMIVDNKMYCEVVK